MSAAACAPTRLGMFTFAAADRMPPPPQPPPPSPAQLQPALEQEMEMVTDAGAGEGTVHPQLWLACAGSMCTVPPVGAAVYYFPQGHAEQAAGHVDLSAASGIPPFVPCRVAAVRYMAEPHTDEVFAKIRLVPLRPGEPVADAAAGDDQQQPNKPASFAKTLTQSDANNGGGFSVPRFCAETIFPELDYRAEPPVQSVYARDVHGAEWTFRHIYRGTPRRHLLTTGWSNFVNRKKLLAGDSIVFLRGENGRVHVGLRRAKRGGGGFGGAGDGWGDAYGPSVAAARGGNASGKVPPEDVAAAARLAAAGQAFEVVHYPRASTPEFCVRADTVRASMQVPWCPGMRFKMAFETEDSSRISWFMGTVAAVKPADSNRWPQSPWRLLQVTWDEPELLQNVQRVCPWLVEQVSSMPNLHLPNFAPPPPRKKPRIPELPFDGQPLLFDLAAGFPLHQNHHHHHHGLVPFLPFPDGSAAAAGIQGARHAQVAPPLFPDLLHIGNTNLQQTLLPCGFRPAADHHSPAPPPTISTDLAIGIPPPPPPPPRSPSRKAAGKVKPPAGIMLFGQAILIEEQMRSNGETSPPPAAAAGNKGSPDGSGSGVTEGSPAKNKSSLWAGDNNSPSECKVFVESDAVGRSLDLSALGSFEELCARLSAMFCIDAADLRSRLLYRTADGEEKHAGDEPFRLASTSSASLQFAFQVQSKTNLLPLLSMPKLKKILSFPPSCFAARS
ncbi:unnamed protein product [Urochloa decumbens]|uniref:Auxin response factor n=1 Tax=Urochloa decumbens TaxID=240449 RepID=A0ABC9C8N0_9POAL